MLLLYGKINKNIRKFITVIGAINDHLFQKTYKDRKTLQVLIKRAPSIDEALSGRSAFIPFRRTSWVPLDPEASGLGTGFSPALPHKKSPVFRRGFERETGFEPATFSLEG